MISWRERLQQGSFRDVAFFTESASGEGGRRVAVHEYPQQEVYFSEDLGKKAESEKLKIYLIGHDYDQQRDELLKQLVVPGPGKLVHPFLGTMQIQVQQYDWSISANRGGYIEFNIQYVRAGQITPPKASSNETSTAVEKAKKDVEEKIEKKFKEPSPETPTGGPVKPLSVNNTASYVRKSSVDKMRTFTFSLAQLNAEIAGYLEPISNVASAIDQFGGEVATLLRQPANLVTEVIGVVASVFGAVDDIKVALKSYDHLLAGFGAHLVKGESLGPGSKNTEQEAQNDAALNVLITSAATLATVNRIVTIQEQSSNNFRASVLAPEENTAPATASAFTSLQEAQATRDKLINTIDAIMDSGQINDEEYLAWSDLQSALVRYINAIEPNLAKEKTTQLNQSVPALVLAYQLYGDASREEELVTRNRIANPNFVPAGVDLEVLE